MWLAVVVLVGAFVLADFARSPLFPGSGAAAIAAPQVTLWVPSSEAGGEGGEIAEAAAAGFELAGHPATVKRLPGGTSAAVTNLLARPPRDGGSDLLVVTSATLAGLARDEADRLVPGAAGQALEASALLRRSTPLGLLAEEPLALAAAPESGISTGAELIERVRREPERCVFAIDEDGWSRDQLAVLVNRVGEGGDVHFVSGDSGSLAAGALDVEGANLVMAPRDALRPELRAGRLRAVRWPLGHAPRDWVALVAPPVYGGARLGVLRGMTSALIANRAWRRRLHAQGRRPGVSHGDLRLRLRRDLRRAVRQERLTRSVERLAD